MIQQLIDTKTKWGIEAQRINSNFSIIRQNSFNINVFPRINNETDDTARLQRAVDYLDSIGGGCLFLNAETYTTLRVVAKSNIYFVGDNKKTILKSKDGRLFADGYAMIDVQVAENVHFFGISFDGNKANVQDIEQLHTIRFDRAKNCSVKNCRFFNSRGDSIIIVGIDYPTENLIIEHNLFEGTGRNSITLGSGFKGIHILSNRFYGATTAQHIDCEASWPSALCSDLYICYNDIDGTLGGGLITTSGQEGNDYNMHAYIMYNSIKNGAIRTTFSRHVWIGYNSIVNTEAQQFSPVFGGYVTDDVHVIHNYINDVYSDYGIHFTHTGGFFSENISICYNTVISKGIYVIGVSDVQINNNNISGSESGGGVSFVNSANNDGTRSIKIKDNNINGYGRSISIIAQVGFSVDNVVLIGNTLDSFSEYGIYLSNAVGEGSITDIQISGNSYKNGTIYPIILNGMYYRISGNNGMVENLAGSGNPEGIISAKAGSTFQSDAGFFVKTGTGNTGWILK